MTAADERTNQQIDSIVAELRSALIRRVEAGETLRADLPDDVVREVTARYAELVVPALKRPGANPIAQRIGPCTASSSLRASCPAWMPDR